MSPIRRVGGATAAAGLGYLVGTIPSAELITRVATGGRVDIRAEGTGNPGAANVATVLGKRWGFAVAMVDVAKGVAGARLGGAVGGRAGRHVGGPAAVLGHCFPGWSSFEGGKGVATSVGQVIGTFPVYLPIDLVVGAVASRLPVFDRKAFAATEVASVTWVLAATLWWRKRWPNPGGAEPTIGLPLGALATGWVIRMRFLQTNDRVEAWRRRVGQGREA